MSIDFQCACGKTLRVADGYEGRKVRCPSCGNVSVVPSAPVPASGGNEYELNEPAPRPVTRQPVSPPATVSLRPVSSVPTYNSSYPSPDLASRSRGVRGFMYLLLVLAFIPLIWMTFQKHETFGDKLARTVLAHKDEPDVIANLDKDFNEDGTLIVSEEDFFNSLPNNRLEGALLPRTTEAHWLMALAAAVAFFAFYMIAFRGATKFAGGMLLAGVFTGTLGIVLLLGFQWAAFSMPMIIPHGVIGLVLLVVKLIGESYRLAEGDTGFFLSFLGFTCGVGLCEEITKAIPLLFRVKSIPGETYPSWYNLLLWGLASGTGFGIAEGIMYSGHYYNGIEGSGMYLVRFASCVVLHAMWAGANGINLYRKQGDLAGSANNWEYFGRVILIVLVPMILHGLYDTLLKQEHDGFALLVAVATFGWLVFQIERAYRAEPAPMLATT